MTAALKPGIRHGEACVYPALEVDPLAACLESLSAARAQLGGASLCGDLSLIAATLLREGRSLELEGLEGLVFQLATLVAILDHEGDEADEIERAARGWVELSRRLLLWHIHLHCRDLYQFDAG